MSCYLKFALKDFPTNKIYEANIDIERKNSSTMIARDFNIMFINGQNTQKSIRKEKN